MLKQIRCRYCGRDFLQELNRAKLASRRALYCSEECFQMASQSQETSSCPACGKAVPRYAPTAPFCSVVCRVTSSSSGGRRAAGGTNPHICQMVGCFESATDPIPVADTGETLYLCARHRAQHLSGELSVPHVASMTVRYIHDLRVKRLNRLYDERGNLCEILRCDDPLYRESFPSGFAQAYITHVNPGVVKGWHLHLKQKDHFFGVYGTAKVVLYDERDDSPTRGLVNEIILTPERPMVVQIPERVWHGFMALSSEGAGILNFPTRLYDYADPDEYRCDPHSGEIPYSWAVEDR